jgi:hypothetical protein
MKVCPKDCGRWCYTTDSGCGIRRIQKCRIGKIRLDESKLLDDALMATWKGYVGRHEEGQQLMIWVYSAASAATATG